MCLLKESKTCLRQFPTTALTVTTSRFFVRLTKNFLRSRERTILLQTKPKPKTGKMVKAVSIEEAPNLKRRLVLRQRQPMSQRPTITRLFRFFAKFKWKSSWGWASKRTKTRPDATNRALLVPRCRTGSLGVCAGRLSMLASTRSQAFITSTARLKLSL